jgi:hypothetical protein
MSDVIFLVVGVLFFVASVGFAVLCSRLEET